MLATQNRTHARTKHGENFIAQVVCWYSVWLHGAAGGVGGVGGVGEVEW